MYEDYSGVIQRFETSDKKLTWMPHPVIDRSIARPFYVYTESQFEKLLRTGRPLDDIAVVRTERAHGRDGKTIDFLFWGKDPSVYVRYGNKVFFGAVH